MSDRIGIYSGTFDPIHQGHISFALKTIEEYGLDQVVFLPEANPRGKESVTSLEHRNAIINKALVGHQKLSVTNLASLQFSITKTLPLIRELYGDASLVFLVGSDVVRTFSYRWDNLDILLKDVSLAIGMRVGDNPDDIATIMNDLEKQFNIPIHYKVIHTPNAAVASSHVRNKNAPTSHLHPDVSKYIKENNLYM